MDYSDAVWRQLKNLTKGELEKALVRDGWQLDQRAGSRRLYLKDKRRVAIDYHKSSDTMGRKLLKALLDDVGWSEDDLRRLKLVK